MSDIKSNGGSAKEHTSEASQALEGSDQPNKDSSASPEIPKNDSTAASKNLPSDSILSGTFEEFSSLPDQAVLVDKLAKIRDSKKKVIDMLDQLKTNAGGPENIDKAMLSKLLESYDGFKEQEEQYMKILEKVMMLKEAFDRTQTGLSEVAEKTTNFTADESEVKVAAANNQELMVATGLFSHLRRSKSPVSRPADNNVPANSQNNRQGAEQNASTELVQQHAGAEAEPAEANAEENQEGMGGELDALKKQRDLLQKMVTQQQELRTAQAKKAEAQVKVKDEIVDELQEEMTFTRSLVRQQAESIEAKRRELAELKARLASTKTITAEVVSEVQDTDASRLLYPVVLPPSDSGDQNQLVHGGMDVVVTGDERDDNRNVSGPELEAAESRATALQDKLRQLRSKKTKMAEIMASLGTLENELDAGISSTSSTTLTTTKTTESQQDESSTTGKEPAEARRSTSRNSDGGSGKRRKGSGLTKVETTKGEEEVDGEEAVEEEEKEKAKLEATLTGLHSQMEELASAREKLVELQLQANEITATGAPLPPALKEQIEFILDKLESALPPLEEEHLGAEVDQQQQLYSSDDNSSGAEEEDGYSTSSTLRIKPAELGERPDLEALTTDEMTANFERQLREQQAALESIQAEQRKMTAVKERLNEIHSEELSQPKAYSSSSGGAVGTEPAAAASGIIVKAREPRPSFLKEEVRSPQTPGKNTDRQLTESQKTQPSSDPQSIEQSGGGGGRSRSLSRRHHENSLKIGEGSNQNSGGMDISMGLAKSSSTTGGRMDPNSSSSSSYQNTFEGQGPDQQNPQQQAQLTQLQAHIDSINDIFQNIKANSSSRCSSVPPPTNNNAQHHQQYVQQQLPTALAQPQSQPQPANFDKLAASLQAQQVMISQMMAYQQQLQVQHQMEMRQMQAAMAQMSSTNASGAAAGAGPGLVPGTGAPLGFLGGGQQYPFNNNYNLHQQYGGQMNPNMWMNNPIHQNNILPAGSPTMLNTANNNNPMFSSAAQTAVYTGPPSSTPNMTTTTGGFRPINRGQSVGPPAVAPSGGYSTNQQYNNYDGGNHSGAVSESDWEDRSITGVPKPQQQQFKNYRNSPMGEFD